MSDDIIFTGESGAEYRVTGVLSRRPDEELYSVVNVEGRPFTLQKRVGLEALNELQVYRRMMSKTTCHPDINCIVDSFTDTAKGEIYIVYPPFDYTVEQLIEQHPNGLPMPYLETAIYNLLEGLFYIHSSNMAHRDIQPRNIFVIANPFSLRIGDLALTCSDSVNSGLSKCSFVKDPGNGINYLAPEVAARIGSSSTLKQQQAADIFSMGLIIHNLCYGRKGFDNSLFSHKYRFNANNKTQLAVMSSLKNGDINIPEKNIENLPFDHAKLLGHMVNADSSYRQSIGTLLNVVSHDTESKVVNYFKPFIYEALRQFRAKAKDGNIKAANPYNPPYPIFNFALVGGLAMQMQLENRSLIPSLDADVHVWDERPTYNADVLARDLKNFVDNFFLYSDFMKSQKLNIEYFRKMTGQDFYHSHSVGSSNVGLVLTRIRVFGFDLSDLVCKKHNYDEYFMYKDLPILKIVPLYNSQIEMLAREFSEGFKDPNLRQSINKNKPTQMGLVQRLIESEIDNKISGKLFLQRNYVDGMPDHFYVRIPKAYDRLFLIRQSFINKGVFPSFKAGKSSCIVLRYAVGSPNGRDIYADQKDLDYCASKTVQGGNIKNTFQDGFRQGEEVDKALLNSRRLTWKPAAELKDAIYKWTVDSGPYTTECRTWYLSKTFGIPHIWNTNNLDLLQKLQRATMSWKLTQPVRAYKTARNIIFDQKKTSVDFKEGDSIFQYMFHSTTVNPAIDLVHFSGYEVGTCAYIMNLPKGLPCIYIGNDPLSHYPNEYELLLPFGCTFKIRKVYDDHYIAAVEGENTPSNVRFYQVKVYEIDVIPPRVPTFDPNSIDAFSDNFFVSNTRGQRKKNVLVIPDSLKMIPKPVVKPTSQPALQIEQVTPDEFVAPVVTPKPVKTKAPAPPQALKIKPPKQKYIATNKYVTALDDFIAEEETLQMELAYPKTKEMLILMVSNFYKNYLSKLNYESAYQFFSEAVNVGWGVMKMNMRLLIGLGVISALGLAAVIKYFADAIYYGAMAVMNIFGNVSKVSEMIFKRLWEVSLKVMTKEYIFS